MSNYISDDAKRRARKAIDALGLEDRLAWTDEPVDTVVLEESVFSFPQDGELYMQCGSFTFIEGETYTVSFNGIKYQCVARYNSFGDICYIGNGNLCYETTDDTQPFAFLYDGCTVLVVSEPGEYSVSVSTVQSKVHKIDEKYLPDNILQGDKRCVRGAFVIDDYPEAELTYLGKSKDDPAEEPMTPDSWREFCELCTKNAVVLFGNLARRVDLIKNGTEIAIELSQMTSDASGKYIHLKSSDYRYHYDEESQILSKYAYQNTGITINTETFTIEEMLV